MIRRNRRTHARCSRYCNLFVFFSPVVFGNHDCSNFGSYEHMLLRDPVYTRIVTKNGMKLCIYVQYIIIPTDFPHYVFGFQEETQTSSIRLTQQNNNSTPIKTRHKYFCINPSRFFGRFEHSKRPKNLLAGSIKRNTTCRNSICSVMMIRSSRRRRLPTLHRRPSGFRR